MDGMIHFGGLLGVVILLASIGILTLLLLVNGGIVIYLYYSRKIISVWLKCFLVSTASFLIFDLLFLFSYSGTVFTKETGTAFDWQMLFIWTPSHIIGYFLIPFIARKLLIFN